MYAKCGKPEVTLQRWKNMDLNNASHITLVSVLTACAALGTEAALEVGCDIYKKVIENLHPSEEALNNMLMTMFLKCGQPTSALDFWKTRLLGYRPLSLVYCTTALTACANIGVKSLTDGKNIHSLLKNQIGDRYLLNAHIVTALVNMYTKAGSVETALQIWKVVRQKGLHKLCVPLYVAVLKACSASKTPTALEMGEIIHKELDSGGFMHNKNNAQGAQ